MTISGVSRHRVSDPPPRRDRRLVYGAAALAVVLVAGIAYAVWPNSSPSSTAGGGAATRSVASHAGALELNASGSQLVSWNQTSTYCAQDSISTGDGTVATDSTGNAAL